MSTWFITASFQRLTWGANNPIMDDLPQPRLTSEVIHEHPLMWLKKTREVADKDENLKIYGEFKIHLLFAMKLDDLTGAATHPQEDMELQKFFDSLYQD